MIYKETIETFENMFELQHYMNNLLQKVQESGKILDAEITVDLPDLSITITAPEELDEN